MGKPNSEVGRLGRRVAYLKDGQSVGCTPGGLVEEARKIRNGLDEINACTLLRRTVQVVNGRS
jgi:hypothetical protein